MKVGPAGVARLHSDARVKGVWDPLQETNHVSQVSWIGSSTGYIARTIPSPTDDQPPPGQEGDAVAKPWLRKVGDGAGVGGREQLHT